MINAILSRINRPDFPLNWTATERMPKIAWKTGTSFGFRDGWAIGITPANVVAVWVGNADGEGRPGLIGVNTAAPILFDIFRLLPNVSWFRQPTYNYVYTAVCRQSGYRANIDCPVNDTFATVTLLAFAAKTDIINAVARSKVFFIA